MPRRQIAQHRPQPIQDPGQVDAPTVRGGLFAEEDELFDQPSPQPDRAPDGGALLPQLLVLALLDEERGHRDQVEDVVDVVGDGTGQSAERDHLVLGQLVLTALAKRDLDLQAVRLLQEQGRHVRGARREVAILLRPDPRVAHVFVADDAGDVARADDRRIQSRRRADQREGRAGKLPRDGVVPGVGNGQHPPLTEGGEVTRVGAGLQRLTRRDGVGRTPILTEVARALAGVLEQPDAHAFHVERVGADAGQLPHGRLPRVLAVEAKPSQLEPSGLETCPAAVRRSRHRARQSISA